MGGRTGPTIPEEGFAHLACIQRLSDECRESGFDERRSRPDRNLAAVLVKRSKQRARALLARRLVDGIAFRMGRVEKLKRNVGRSQIQNATRSPRLSALPL
jgi:hypothetical protein